MRAARIDEVWPKFRRAMQAEAPAKADEIDALLQRCQGKYRVFALVDSYECLSELPTERPSGDAIMVR